MLLSLHAHRRTRGFSLIELAVVLIVIALIAAIAIPTLRTVIQRSAERAEAAGVTAVGRDAVALAAFDNVSPPEPDHYQVAFDESQFGAAAAAGLLADGGHRVVVWDPNWPGAPSAERVFLYGDDESENTSVVISPAASHPDRCVALAVVGTVARGAIIDPVAYHAEAEWSIEEQCNTTVALNWALDRNDEPEPPATTDPGDGPDPEPTVPAVPTGLTGQPYSSVVDLTWDAVDELGVTYDVSRDGAEVASGLTDPMYSDEGLEPSTAYTYRVRACVEVCSEWSSEIQVTTTIAAPAAPTGFAFTNATSNAISFTWDADGGAETYEVQRQGTSAVSTTNTSYTATGLAASIGEPKTYNFRVRACNATGCSEWTSYASMTTAGYMRRDATSTASAANRSGTEWLVNVPAGVKAVFLQAAGAKGANGVACPSSGSPAGTGARGANVRGVVTVTPGDTLVAKVGKQGHGRFGGWPGGGNGTVAAMEGYCAAMANAGAGGGYTSWARNGTPILVAGGGGGGGSTSHDQPNTQGGNGGAPGLSNGGNASAGGNGGGAFGIGPRGGVGGRGNGGTANGGDAIVVGNWVPHTGGNGSQWTGGNSGNYGGGGGGGYGGGGAGGALGDPGLLGRGWGAGGGGGSSYAAAGVTGLTITQITGLDEGRACISWHGDTTCAGGSAPFVP